MLIPMKVFNMIMIRNLTMPLDKKERKAYI